MKTNIYRKEEKDKETLQEERIKEAYNRIAADLLNEFRKNKKMRRH